MNAIKQIIGLGTRTFECKNYFTIYDFVKTHERFEDDDWDGDPAIVIIDPPGRREGTQPPENRR